MTDGLVVSVLAFYSHYMSSNPASLFQNEKNLAMKGILENFSKYSEMDSDCLPFTCPITHNIQS